MGTLQTMKELRGSLAIKSYVDNRVEEEAQALALGDGPEIAFSLKEELTEGEAILAEVDPSKGVALRISELAILLGGEGRNGRFVGRGWGSEGPTIDPNDGAEIAITMTERASSRTEIHAISQVFTVPKSESLLAAMDHTFADRLLAARRLALEEAIACYESKLTIVYRGDDGKKIREPIKGIRGLAHDHAASAAGDPHAHNHLMFSTTAQGVSGRWGQVDVAPIRWEIARKAQAIYDRRIRIELKRMGLKLNLSGELFGVSRDLIDRASTAHNAIKALQTAVSAATGIEISDDQAWKHWRQIVSGHDDLSIPSELRQQILGERNVTIPPELVAVLARLRGDLAGGMSGEALEHAIDSILSNPETQAALSAFFGARYGIDKDWAKNVWQASAVAPEIDPVDAMIADIEALPCPPTLFSAQALSIKHSQSNEQELFDEVLADPRVTVAVNASGRVKRVCLVSQEVREQRVRTIAEELLPEITGTIGEQLADLTMPLTVIMGVAGGGKSSELMEAREAWAGRTVWATARNRYTATDTGRAAGAEGYRTLSTAALWDRCKSGRGPQKGDVLVVDESGLLDHRDVVGILNLALRGVIVKALGDQHQIQPIDRSTSARIVMDVAARKGAAALDESKRCAAWIELHDKLRAVTVSSEVPKEVIDELVDMLDIRICHTPNEVAELMASAPTGSEIVTQSNRLRAEIAEGLPRPAWPEDFKQWLGLTDGGVIWPGCEVVVRKNIWGRDLSGPVAQNGETGTITHVNKTHVTIEFSDRQITLNRRTAKASLRTGGARTGDSSQGQTWEGSSIVTFTGKETKQWAYSALTRGKIAPIFAVLVDKDDDADLVQKWAREMVTEVLNRDGIARTVAELKREALQDKTQPREPGEMVPWLRNYWGKLGGLASGVEDGSMSVERPEADDTPKPAASTPAQIAALLDEINKETGQARPDKGPKPTPPRLTPEPPGPRRPDGPAGPT